MKEGRRRPSSRMGIWGQRLLYVCDPTAHLLGLNVERISYKVLLALKSTNSQVIFGLVSKVLEMHIVTQNSCGCMSACVVHVCDTQAES